MKKSLKKKKKELEQMLNDENASTSERENARQEIDEINQELNAIENEREIEAERLSFRDFRLWEKIKAVFKKYGVTVTAIFLAAGVTIASVVSVITNAVIFKAAGSVIGFLAEHTWILILAVVAFLIENLKKGVNAKP